MLRRNDMVSEEYRCDVGKVLFSASGEVNAEKLLTEKKEREKVRFAENLLQRGRVLTTMVVDPTIDNLAISWNAH
jgi:hypothetical protein